MRHQSLGFLDLLPTGKNIQKEISVTNVGFPRETVSKDHSLPKIEVHGDGWECLGFVLGRRMKCPPLVVEKNEEKNMDGFEKVRVSVTPVPDRETTSVLHLVIA